MVKLRVKEKIGCFLRSSFTIVPFPTPDGPIIIRQDIK